jgi:DNA-binding CsgD family transcriptional regulator
VGRERELGILNQALLGPEPVLLFVSGDAGVGKTSLLHEFQGMCGAFRANVSRIDARRLDLSTPLASSRLGRRILGELAVSETPAGTASSRPVLLIDDYEALGAAEAWLLEDLAPRLPDSTLIVAFSRRSPPLGLLLDPGFASVMKQERLDPFDDGDARLFLERRRVPSEARTAILKLSGGHPLALSLSAEVLGSEVLTEHKVHDIQRKILGALCREPGSRLERLALGLAAVARAVTLELLEYVLAALGDSHGEDPQRLYTWLCGLSLIEPRRIGLFLQPLIRSGVLARLRRERRLEYEALHLAVREFCIEKLVTGADGSRWLKDLLYAQATAPAERAFGTADEDDLAIEPARPADHAAIIEFLRELQGDESAAIAAGFLASRPKTFEIVRGERLEAVLQALMLDVVSLELLPEEDPASALVLAFLRENPLRPEEQAVFFRFRVDRVDGQLPSRRMTAVIARETQLVLSMPAAAYSFAIYGEFSGWKEILDYAGVRYRQCGTFACGGVVYAVVACLWRERSLRELLLSAGRDGVSPRKDNDPVIGAAEAAPGSDLQIKVRKRVVELGRRARLTARELEILELLCLGKSAAEIARVLSIRPRTVKFHQENVLRKAGVGSRLELFKLLL